MKKAHGVLGITIVSLFSFVFLAACACCGPFETLVRPASCYPQYSPSKAGVALPPIQRIAYVKDGDVWVMKSDGTEGKRLTKTAERETSLSYSYYNERIWFIKATSYIAETIGVGDVWSMKLDGTDLKQVTSGLKARFAVVAPNGKQLAVSVTRTVANIYPGGQSGETWDLWVLDADAVKQTESSEKVDLSSDLAASGIGGREGAVFAAWSPQGDKIAFTFKADTSSSLGISTRQVYVVENDGGDRKKGADSCDYPAWSSYGDYIAVDYGSHWDTIGLKVIRSDGTFYKEIEPVPTQDLYSVGRPAWLGGAVEKRLVYVVTTHPAAPATPTYTLYKTNVETLEKTELAKQTDVNKLISDPAISTLYEQIVFQVGRASPATEKNASIWIVKADGTGLKQLTPGPDDSQPIWTTEKQTGKTGGGAATGWCHYPRIAE